MHAQGEYLFQMSTTHQHETNCPVDEHQRDFFGVRLLSLVERLIRDTATSMLVCSSDVDAEQLGVALAANGRSHISRSKPCSCVVSSLRCHHFSDNDVTNTAGSVTILRARELPAGFTMLDVRHVYCIGQSNAEEKKRVMDAFVGSRCARVNMYSFSFAPYQAESVLVPTSSERRDERETCPE